MPELAFDPASIATASGDISTGASGVRRILDDMDAQLAPLRETWTGEASSAYTAAQSKWNAAIADMNLLLQDISRAVGDGGQNYDATERKNTARW
ncbi:WXG100 family type VII secretion target [Salana multivorans]|uniref:ESAT-6-like protein n=1 Tax=Salana multivorans TaxID=120377 RepID=A0A3N2D8D9_9MICO|nr:WXG100 family type VII secretion target [Salana multivorans]MBN9189248.1 WXG100 family type VII secretion target [Microbacterium sp.]OJX93837.1 MAG: type VII secretion protein [Micrococcales bacterium 73-15]ROR96053.1 WXG100 family type VII secretion target [Salana multivorans]